MKQIALTDEQFELLQRLVRFAGWNGAFDDFEESDFPLYESLSPILELTD